MAFSDPLIPGKLYYLTTNSEHYCIVFEYPPDREEHEDCLVGEIGILDTFLYLGQSPEGLELVLLADGTTGWMDVWWEYHHFGEVVTEE
ncbi:MAG: hypothetical protein E6R04_07765 [Spirochaetes bacterium]|nr:MAG: hypothetical protein E6R04_07765 [Spirochaetota bacterium]